MQVNLLHYVLTVFLHTSHQSPEGVIPNHRGTTCEIWSHFEEDQTHFIPNGSAVPYIYSWVVTPTLLRRGQLNKPCFTSSSAIQLTSSSVAVFQSQRYKFKPD